MIFAEKNANSDSEVIHQTQVFFFFFLLNSNHISKSSLLLDFKYHFKSSKKNRTKRLSQQEHNERGMVASSWIC